MPEEAAARNNFYEQKSRTEAEKRGVQGILILITRNPPHLQVTVGETTGKLFTESDRKYLMTRLTDAFAKIVARLEELGFLPPSEHRR